MTETTAAAASPIKADAPGSPSKKKLKVEEEPTATTAAVAPSSPSKALKTENGTTPTSPSKESKTENTAPVTNGATPVKAEGGGKGVGEAEVAKIRELVDFYFGDANFRRDKFMKTEAEKDPEGYIKIAVLLTFNKLKQITTDEKVLASAVGEGTSVVKLSEDKTSIKRITPLPEEDDSHLRTLFVDGLPKTPAEGHKEVSVDDMVKLFSQWGEVTYVRVTRERVTKKLTGCAFVEFKSTSDVAKVLGSAAIKKDVTLSGKTIKLKVRKYDKDHKAKQAERSAAAASNSSKKRKAEGDAEEGEGKKGEGKEGEEGEGGKKEPNVYDFEVPENFEAELKTLIPRHVKLAGIKEGTPYYELREFLGQYGEVKYVTQDKDNGSALVKFLNSETAGKFLGETPEIKEVMFRDEKLTIGPASEDEVRVQLKAKNERKRANLEGTGRAGKGGGRGGGGRGKGRGGGGRGRGSKRGRKH